MRFDTFTVCESTFWFLKCWCGLSYDAYLGYLVPLQVRDTTFLKNLKYEYVNLHASSEIYSVSIVTSIFIKSEIDNWNIIKKKSKYFKRFFHANTFFMYPPSQINQRKMGTDRCIPYEYGTHTRHWYVPVRVLHYFKSTHSSKVYPISLLIEMSYKLMQYFKFGLHDWLICFYILFWFVGWRSAQLFLCMLLPISIGV
jgi:hypothetical protein